MVSFHGNKKREAHFPDSLLERNLVSMGQGVMMPVINILGQFSKLLASTLSFRPHGNPKGTIIKPFYRWESGGGSFSHLWSAASDEVLGPLMHQPFNPPCACTSQMGKQRRGMLRPVSGLDPYLLENSSSLWGPGLVDWASFLFLKSSPELWTLCDLEGTWLNMVQMYLVHQPKSQEDGVSLQGVGSVNSDFFWCYIEVGSSVLDLYSQLG